MGTKVLIEGPWPSWASGHSSFQTMPLPRCHDVGWELTGCSRWSSSICTSSACNMADDGCGYWSQTASVKAVSLPVPWEPVGSLRKELVQWVFFPAGVIALTLYVGWQEGHPAFKKLFLWFLKVHGTRRKRMSEADFHGDYRYYHHFTAVIQDNLR